MYNYSTTRRFISLDSHMASKVREELRKRVLQHHNSTAQGSKSATVKHFQEENVPRSTCYRIIANDRVEDLPHPGRPAVKATPVIKNKIKRLFDNNDKMSVRAAGIKLGLSKSYVAKIKTKQFHIKSYRKRVAPKYVKQQAQRAQSGAKYLYRRILPSGGGKILVIDDETYFPEDPTEIAGVEFYHTSSQRDVPKPLTVKHRGKYCRRYLVWQAIGADGSRSEPYITMGQTINAAIYLQHCIKERLLPFIDKHYNRNNVLFWPDLATSHYQRDVLQYLQDSGVEVVRKEKNPPSLPQARPIERYWALVKREYKKRRQPPKNLRSFARIYHNDSKKVSRVTVRTLMEGVRGKLRLIGNEGPLAAT